MNSVKQFGHEKRGVKKIEDFFFESNKLSLANWSDWVGGLDWKKRETEDKREKIEEKGKKSISLCQFDFVVKSLSVVIKHDIQLEPKSLKIS